MSGVLILVAVLTAALLPLLMRDLRRADMLRRRREFLRTDPEALRIAAAFRQAQVAIGVAMLPAMGEMVRVAADFAATMRKVQAAMQPKDRP